MTLLRIETCVDEEERMTGFKWVFADDSANKVVSLPIFGYEGVKCDEKSVTGGTSIEKIKVFLKKDEEIVSGLRIKLTGDTDELTLGLQTGDYVDYEFESGAELAVGYYGTLGAMHVSELGFIVLDVDCAKKNVLQADQE